MEYTKDHVCQSEIHHRNDKRINKKRVENAGVLYDTVEVSRYIYTDQNCEDINKEQKQNEQ